MRRVGMVGVDPEKLGTELFTGSGPPCADTLGATMVPEVVVLPEKTGTDWFAGSPEWRFPARPREGNGSRCVTAMERRRVC